MGFKLQPLVSLVLHDCNGSDAPHLEDDSLALDARGVPELVVVPCIVHFVGQASCWNSWGLGFRHVVGLYVAGSGLCRMLVEGSVGLWHGVLQGVRAEGGDLKEAKAKCCWW